MRSADLLSLSLFALRARKLRSSLTILGVAIGIATIVVLLSQTEGLRAATVEQIGKTGVTTIVVTPQARTQLSELDANRIQGIGGVRYVSPFYRAPARIISGGSTLEVVLLGIDHDMIPVIFQGLTLGQGQLLAPFNYFGVVLGGNVRNSSESGSFIPEVGQLVNFQVEARIRGQLVSFQRAFRVEGIVSPYGASLLAPIDDTAFLSLAAAKGLFARQFYDGIIVVVENAEEVKPVTEQLSQIYADRIRVVSPQQLLERLGTILGQVETFLGGIAAISLLVAGVGITNIMYISVVERTRTIGLFKAVGAKPITIMLLFLTEAILIGVIGGMAGIVSGTVITHTAGSLILPFRGFGPATFQRFPARGFAPTPSAIQPLVSLELILAALVFAVAISALAGFYPARKAAKLDPATALRYE